MLLVLGLEERGYKSTVEGSSDDKGEVERSNDRGGEMFGNKCSDGNESYEEEEYTLKSVLGMPWRIIGSLLFCSSSRVVEGTSRVLKQKTSLDLGSAVHSFSRISRTSVDGDGR